MVKEGMTKSIDHLVQELQKIRAGKASPDMISSVMVDYYGSPTPLNQVANVTAADSRTLSIQAWEKNMLAPIEKAIFAAEESLWQPDMKARVVAARGDDTIRTSVFDTLSDRDWPAPFDGRAVRIDAAERWQGREAELRENVVAERAAFADAGKRGDPGTKVVWAGESVDLVHDVQPAGDIVAQTVDEAVLSG